MNIALLAPFEEPVPPEKYGGTELIVANVAAGLVEAGHQVFVLATGDSTTAGQLIPIFPRAIRKESFAQDGEARHALKLMGVARVLQHLQSLKVDIIHNHLGWRFVPFAQQLAAPTLTTIHHPLDIPYQQLVFHAHREHPYVSLTNAQRRPMPELNYMATVHNGIDISQFNFSNAPGKYLAFLGRMSPEKGPAVAIEVAKAAGLPLKMAAKVDAVDTQYFEHEIKPLIDNRQIEFIGEVGPKEKSEFLRNAIALLVPIQWEEPFGLFMVEALACGTPVVALSRGSVPELIVHGQTGFIAHHPTEMVASLKTIATIAREDCRRYAEKHFTIAAMTAQYLTTYEKVLASAT